jgi:serine/threonine-protein kinase RsbW
MRPLDSADAIAESAAPAKQFTEKSYSSPDTEEQGRIIDVIIEQMKALGWSDPECFSARLALEEAAVNAAKHGNQFDPAKPVTIKYLVTAETVTVSVADKGKGYDPDDVPDPTAVENLERPCGRGLMLMRHYMGQVEHNDTFTEVTMTKRRKAVTRQMEALMSGS